MPTILNLIATQVKSTTEPPSGTTQGTRLIFTDDLREDGAPLTTPPFGQHAGDCVLVREPSWWFCRAGWFLPDGNLVAGGLLDFDAPGPKFKVAIFGGTDAYEDARGEIDGTRLPTPTQIKYKLTILP